jgi:hypothetical protein
MTDAKYAALRRRAILTAHTKLPPDQKAAIRNMATALAKNIKSTHRDLAVGDATALEIVGAVALWMAQIIEGRHP